MLSFSKPNFNTSLIKHLVINNNLYIDFAYLEPTSNQLLIPDSLI